ncbi:MAG: molybdate ABC transporter substrate-binding protein [Nitrospira sp.]|uniref:Molybdenum ABC transporter, periplasmic molybdenum-binding protein ModA (TC 3.A.1.8.1) n=1 Tax=Nitrospira defluvii TaxID=330214 RepID=A0ABM8S2A8_9BACT|nr:molybdate ABC transporter substrate-binding protein [Nitrospira defluvii]MCS6327097.1 molybdate ABC transporter substrate-binding protein [Nitrospira sp.]CAE6784902.1 Molybdenum ABC transporter, periplasmic molybdenum-binding protein ModA (TC 3.A.1.8.1) [Nitrospira defluvii]
MEKDSKGQGYITHVVRAFLSVALFLAVPSWFGIGQAGAAESFVIAASPSLKGLLERLGSGFEHTHPNVRVKLYFDSGLQLRQTIAGMENSMVGQYFIGTGPINLVAPGGDEVITRLQVKYYVLPGTTRSYAVDQLVLVVPESLVEAPGSFEALAQGRARLAIAERTRTRLGAQTADMLRASGMEEVLKGRLDVATDGRGVIDHVLSGQADVGIIWGDQAVDQQQRLRVVGVINKGYKPTVHSMAMERYCPNRRLCEEFLDYIQSAEAQKLVRQAGYAVPPASGR